MEVLGSLLRVTSVATPQNHGAVALPARLAGKEGEEVVMRK